MNCQLCSESNVPSDHHTTERHMKNKTLFDYSVYKKQNVGNKKGIIVSCDVRSSSSTHSQCYESKINVSVKPNEQVEFTFTILNDTKKDKFSINCAQIMHSKLNFTINDHGIDAGSPPHIIKPKSKLNKKITVMFRSASVGEYVMPIVFCFLMNSTNENIVIVRDMVVYVEKQKKLHDKMYSPFVLQSIVAEKTYRCVREGTREEGIFTVPKNYKPIYSSALKCPSNLTQEKAKLVADLRKIFSTGITKMNYVQFFHHLLWYEETVLKNNLKNYNMTGVNLKLGSIPSSYTLVVPGLAEKRPSLLVGDYLFVKPQNEKIMFEANVTLITENDVTIQGMHSTFCKNYTKTKKYDIRFTMSRVTLERMHQAVHFAEQQMPRLFPTHYTNKKKVEPITEFFNVNIRDNLEQRSAVEHIVSGSSGRAPYLVHGPPGTGKTVTIVEAILQASPY